MDTVYLQELQRILEQWGGRFETGLSNEEVSQIESWGDFHFPSDLRQFLQFALPIPDRSFAWPDWRRASPGYIRELLDWPAEGICFDVEHSGFWIDDWGTKPASTEAAVRKAGQAMSNAPTLVPILGNRYIPAEPSDAGNPVYSIWQSDMIYYGYDLVDYFHNEFNPTRYGPEQSANDDSVVSRRPPRLLTTPNKPRPIRLWDAIIHECRGGYAGRGE